MSLRYSIYKVQSPARRLRVLNRNFAILARTFRFVKRNFSLFCDSACFLPAPEALWSRSRESLHILPPRVPRVNPFFIFFSLSAVLPDTAPSFRSGSTSSAAPHFSRGTKFRVSHFDICFFHLDAKSAFSLTFFACTAIIVFHEVSDMQLWRRFYEDEKNAESGAANGTMQ